VLVDDQTPHPPVPVPARRLLQAFERFAQRLARPRSDRYYRFNAICAALIGAVWLAIGLFEHPVDAWSVRGSSVLFASSAGTLYQWRRARQVPR
jgi:hypothetical protein